MESLSPWMYHPSRPPYIFSLSPLHVFIRLTFSIVFCQLIDEWTFDVFALSDVSAGSPLRYLGIDLLNRYGVIHKFKVDETRLYFFFFFFNLTFFRRTYNEKWLAAHC